MNGRRIYHARGKVLGGSSSINGMIFQRGNPLDYRALGAPTRAWRRGSYAQLPAVLQAMETCLAGADEYRGGDGPLELERGPATNPLFRAFFEAVQQAGYELTSDVNGYRQEGFAPLRPQHPPRPAAQRGARLPASGDEAPEPRRAAARAGHARSSSRARAPSASSTARASGAHRAGATRGEVICCGGAFNSPQVLQLSGVGNADALGAARHRRRARPARRRREPAGPPRGLRPVLVHAAGLDGARDALPQAARSWTCSGCSRRGPGATNHFEGGGFAR